MSYRTQYAIALFLAGCNLRPHDDVTGTSGATGTGTTATTTATTGTTAASGTTTSAVDPTTGMPTTGTGSTTGTSGGTSSTGDASGVTGDTTRAFVPVPDEGNPFACDQWIQDCPEGQKCMPYSSDGDSSWDSLKCVDIVPNPAGMYEPCMRFGSGVTGEDTCDKGLMCWYVSPGTLDGICVAMCLGSPDAPSCADPSATCFPGGVLTLCFLGCDPIAQDCPDANLCIQSPFNPSAFTCVLDASSDEGQVFDACEYLNGCDPGLFCVDPSVAVECDPKQPACCDPFCDLNLPNTCPGAGQECVPWYEPGMAPPDYEHVGYCTLPMP